jgi:hypothetical protein
VLIVSSRVADPNSIDLDPDPDPGPILIQGFDDQTLQKKVYS